MSRGVAVAIGALIVGLFSAVASRGLSHQGLLYHDTGSYLLEAKFLREGLDALLTVNLRDGRQPGFWNAMKSRFSGTPLHTGKAGFSAVLCLAGSLVGFSDNVCAYVTVLSSIAGLCLTFCIARKLGDFSCAVYATAALASSTFYLMYARSGLADAVVTLWFLAGLLLYLVWKNSPRRSVAFAVGLCFGLVFCTNQWRSAYMPACLLAVDGLTAWQERWRWKFFLSRLIFASLGFLTPLIAFQMPYVAARALAGPLPFPDFWSQLAERFTTREGLEWFGGFSEMSVSIWNVEGPMLPLLTLAAWGFLIIRWLRKREAKDVQLLAFSLLPFLYFSSVKWHGETLPRTIASVLPVMALGVGEMLGALQKTLRSRFHLSGRQDLVLLTALTSAILTWNLPRSCADGITSSGYSEASRFLSATSKKSFMILGMEPVWRFYLGKMAYEPYARPTSLQELVTRAEAGGVEHVVVDFSTLYSKYGMEYTWAVAHNIKPLATFANPRGASLPYLLDIYGWKRAREVAADPLSAKILIFSIKEIRKWVDRRNAQLIS